MNYLSQMLELDRNVEEKINAGKASEARRLIANSFLSSEDKRVFLRQVEARAPSSKDSGILNYAITALLSGSAGFGLGWYARDKYEEYKEGQMDEILELVKNEMEKK